MNFNASKSSQNVMVKICTRKIICLTLFWMVALQSSVIAAYQNPLELSTGTHCDHQDSANYQDCCHDLIYTATHCNNCFQATLAMVTTDALSFLIQNLYYHTLFDPDLYYPEPTLELFKPPI